MKARILVTFTMFTMVFFALSFSSINKPKAQNAGPGNLLYVGDNISTGSGVMTFRRDDQGNLTRLSRVDTGGKGLFDIVGFNRAPTGIFAATDVGPWEHDGNMFITKDRSRLFVVNQGSDDLSVFNISPDGLTLTPVPGSPFKTGHVPCSVTLAAFDTVVVVNKNDDPGGQKPLGKQGSVQTFKMAANGSLTPVANSEVMFPSARYGESVFAGQTSSPSQALPTEDGKVVFVNDFFGGFIRPFIVQPDGTLKASKPFDLRTLPDDVNPIFGDSMPFGLGLAIVPGKNILYNGLLFENKVAVYTFSPKNGKLKFVRAVENGGVTVCWFAISKSGRFMWTTNQASNGASSYDLSDPLNPKEIQVLKFEGCGEPAQVALSPDGSFIYYCNSSVFNKCPQKDPNTRSNLIHTLRINADGTLTELSQPMVMMDIPLGERIEGLATK